MAKNYTYQIFQNADLLSDDWDVLAQSNIFLSKSYLKVLDKAAPKNMKCHYIALFLDHKIVGIAISQMICLSNVSSFGANKSCFHAKVRDFVFRNFVSNLLFIGNNMLTGQNAYCFHSDIPTYDALNLLEKAAENLVAIFKQKGIKIHLTTFKDFVNEDFINFDIPEFKNYFRFDTQPNMVFKIRDSWFSMDDYVNNLTKKYRDQFKRARKKSDGILKMKFSLEDIIFHKSKIFELYMNVTKNAPFNTFYLAENHFESFKKNLGSHFLFYGYFVDNELVGFNTLIKNGAVIDTYFLGYNDGFQRDKMLYLNMLYDMIGFSINKKFDSIVFARTALEIKSSVGANPIQMFGLMKHHNVLIHKFLPRLFRFFEPEVLWMQRNPFKN